MGGNHSQQASKTVTDRAHPTTEPGTCSTYAPSRKPKAVMPGKTSLNLSLPLALTQDAGIPKALHNSLGPDKGQESRLNATRPYAIILKCLVPLLRITQLGWEV